MKEFSRRLKELRISGGFPQSEVAAQIGTTTQNYSAYENGREPPYEKLVQLAEIFEVTCDYLLGRSDFKTLTDEFTYLEGMRILGISEQIYAELARLPSFQGFLDVIYKYLRTDEREVEKVNEAFVKAYFENADMRKFPPVRLLNRDLFYQSEIARYMKLLDKDYKKYVHKAGKTGSSSDGS